MVVGLPCSLCVVILKKNLNLKKKNNFEIVIFFVRFGKKATQFTLGLRLKLRTQKKFLEEQFRNCRSVYFSGGTV